MHPHGVRPQYSPIENPEQHRTQTLRNVTRFSRFLPWIDAGIVEFIRTQDDLDMDFRLAAMREAEKYFDVPELRNAIDNSTKELADRHSEKVKERLFNSLPDSYLREAFREMSQDEPTNVTEDQIIDCIRRIRSQNLDVIEPIDKTGSQLYITSTGASIPSAKLAAEMSGAYLFTDLSARWEILKYERDRLTAASREWSPFAKALSEVRLNFLNNVDLNVALRLRDEGRLSGVRTVLRASWRADLNEDLFDDTNAIKLGQNLIGAMDEARAEWDEIRADFTKFNLTDLMMGGGLSTAALITTGHAEWIAGVTTAVGLTASKLYSHYRTRGFNRRFPASIFLSLDE